MKKILKTFLLFLCLCCGCTLPRKNNSDKPQTIYYELPPDDSIFADMDMVNLSGYYTYHYDKTKNPVQTNFYCPRDTDDGTWGWHERRTYTYDKEHRPTKEQLFLPYVDNDMPWTETSYNYFSDGYSETCIYSDGKTVESYYNADGKLLLYEDNVHHSQTYRYSCEYDTEGSNENTAETPCFQVYLQVGENKPYLYWKQFSSGKNEKIEIKYYNRGTPEIIWINTYNEEGDRISGNWCETADLPANVSEQTWADYCQPGCRTRYENGKLMEKAEQEWNLNIDGIRTEYTLYDYDKNGNLTLELTYNRLYKEQVTLSRYEYDFWNRMVKQYKYNIDFERYRDWSIPLSDGSSFYFSYGTDQTLIMKRLSAAREMLSAIHCENSRFRVLYIGDEEIRW